MCRKTSQDGKYRDCPDMAANWSLMFYFFNWNSDALVSQDLAECLECPFIVSIPQLVFCHLGQSKCEAKRKRRKAKMALTNEC
jgi:hypothetical protein